MKPFLLTLGVLCGFVLGHAAPPVVQERPLGAEQLREKKAEPKPLPQPADDAEWQVYNFPPQSGRHVVIVSRVIDGDTVAGFFLFGEVKFRLRGIDAPEMKVDGKPNKAGEEAKEYLEKLMPEYLFHAEIEGKDGFGRSVADFWLKEQGGWASELMLKAGKAERYKR